MRQNNTPIGPVGKGPNKQAISRIFGVKTNQVIYIDNGVDLSNSYIVYEEETQTCYNSENIVGVVSSYQVGESVLTVSTSSGVHQLSKLLVLSDLKYSTGAGYIGTKIGNSLQKELDNIGNWIPSASSLMTTDINYDSVRVRGFYYPNDGGEAAWIKTGTVNQLLSGTHVVAEAKIYNKNGYEYVLNVKSGDTIEASANGAIAPNGAIDEDTDNFVCIAEVCNGISSIIKDYSDETKHNKLTIVIRGNQRHGKTSLRAWSFYCIDAMDARIYTRVSKSLKEKLLVSGDKLNLFERGWEDLKATSALYGNNANYGQLTGSRFKIKGGRFEGDHTPSKSKENCFSGHGMYLLNMEYAEANNMPIFNGYSVNVAYMRATKGYYYDNEGVLQTGTLIPELNTSSSVSTTGIGSWEGATSQGMFTINARRCDLRNESNWSNHRAIYIGNTVKWKDSVSGNLLNYLLENYAAGTIYSGTIGSLGNSDYNAAISAIGDTQRGSSYTALYNEHQDSYLTIIPANGVYVDTLSRGSLEKGLGINLDLMASQYRTSRKHPFLKYSPNFFGKYVEDRKWQNPLDWQQFPNINGINYSRYGSPALCLGAFWYGGYDFEYGNHNIGYEGTERPDIDSIKNTPLANEFISPNGLMYNGGASLRFPILNLPYNANTVIWIKDLTGNYDPGRMSMWVSSNKNTDDPDPNAWVAYGEVVTDFNNGYKAISIYNHRFNAPDSRKYAWGSEGCLFISTTSDTPIIIKAIQSFTGGIPIFPVGLPTYTPRSSLTQMWGTENSTPGCNLYAQHFGGGIFKPGDVVDPWAYTRHTGMNQDDYQSLTSFGVNSEARVISSGGAFGGATSSNVTATVLSYSSEFDETLIHIEESSDITSIVMGAPIRIGSASYSISSRVVNSDGTLSRNYTIRGNISPVGEVLIITNNQQTYSFRSTSDSAISGIKGNLSIGGTLSVTGTTTLGGVQINLNAGTIIDGNFRSKTAAKDNIGSAAIPFKDGYFQNAITVISDADHKPLVDSVPESVLDIFDSLEIKRWKYDWAISEKGEEVARWHVGYIAQEIIQAFEKAGLDATEYAFIVWREWDEEPPEFSDVIISPEVIDSETGDVMSESVMTNPGVKAGGRWELVPHEINFIKDACLQRKIKKLESSLT